MDTSPTSAHHTVLVVDDDAELRETICEALSEEGYAVASAGDGLAALELLAQAPTPPSLILLDLMMPRMNGWEFRERQRGDARLAAIPVAVITAGRPTPAKVDADAVIFKPFRLADLLQVVKRLCG